VDKVFRFFIDNHKLSFTLTIFLIVYGIIGLSNINREAIPPVNFAAAVITTEYPGSSPEEVEQKITVKIEDEIRTVSGVREVKSVSLSGRSIITVRMEVDNIDIEGAMGDLQRAVQRVSDLPPDIRENPILQEVNSDELPVIELAITGEQKNRERDAWADRIKTILEDVNGVSSIELNGFTERQFQILLDPAKMRKNMVSTCDVVRAVRSHSLNVPAGYIETKSKRKLVRVRGRVRSLRDVEEIVIKSNFLFNVKVKEIGRVVDGAEDPRVIARVNGVPATLITVVKKASADALETARRIDKKINTIQSGLPEGFQLIVYDNEADRIKARLDVVVTNALTGLLLVLVILLIFLPGRIGVVTALSLPLAILATLGTMAANGINFNVITMLSIVIVIGMLVDNSVVISENYARLRQEGLDTGEAALQAVRQFWIPITATVLTTIAAFLPMLVTKGIMGQFIKYIPIVVTFALVLGLVEAFFILPARLKFTFRGDVAEKTGNSLSSFFMKFEESFTRFMRWGIRRRYIVFLTITVILLSSITLNIFGNHFELFPNEAVEVYVARYELEEGATLERTASAGTILMEEVKKIMGDDVSNYVQKSGIAQVGIDDPKRRDGENVGMLSIYVPLARARNMDASETLEKLRKIKVSEFKALEFANLVNGPPVGNALNLVLRSTDYKEIRAMADLVIKDVAEIEGVKNLGDDEIKGTEEYLIEFDESLIARAQLTVEAVGNCMRAALQGITASTVNLSSEEFDLVVRYGDKYRGSIEKLLNAEVLNNTGNLIKLRKVARVKKRKGPSVKKHFDYLPSIIVTSDIDPNVISSVGLNLKAREIVEKYKNRFPNVSFKFGGEEESTRESLVSLFQAMILALFSIFVILIFLFRSFSKPLLILSSIPLGLVGVSWSFFLHNKPLSFLALIGVVGLAGIIVNSAIVLMSYIDELQNSTDMDFYDILAFASGKRLRAVTVTSITTVGGLLPTAYGLGGYDPTLVPMTFALAWGLISGTVLTIVWIPCGTAVLYDIGTRLKRISIKDLFQKKEKQ
jgi:multidrug efflux pump subunit AcrB